MPLFYQFSLLFVLVSQWRSFLWSLDLCEHCFLFPYALNSMLLGSFPISVKVWLIGVYSIMMVLFRSLHYRFITPKNWGPLILASPSWSFCLSTTQSGLLVKMQERTCMIFVCPCHHQSRGDKHTRVLHISSHHLSVIQQFGEKTIALASLLPWEIPHLWVAVWHYNCTYIQKLIQSTTSTKIINNL